MSWRQDFIAHLQSNILYRTSIADTYGHRTQKARDPVRSPIYKLRTGRVVVRWVTTCEFLLLYVCLFALSFCTCVRFEGDTEARKPFDLQV